jgi:hypothetical protein
LKEKAQILKEQRRKLKRKLRLKRKEILELEEELDFVAKQHKASKTIEQNRKFKEIAIDKVRKGEMRITKEQILKILKGDAA